MHKHEGKSLFVSTAGLVGSGVEGCCGHITVNSSGVLCNKLSVFAAGHCKNTLEDRKDSALVEAILILSDLLCDIVHKINLAGDVIGKITLNPALSTANHNNTLLKGLGAGSGDVGLAVIVDSIAICQATHSNAGIARAVLAGENILDVRVAHEGRGLFQLVHFQVGNGTNLVLKRLSIKALGIKLSVRHYVHLSFLDFIMFWG